MYYSKCINPKYIFIFGYETCEKLIWTSGIGCRNKKVIIKQGIPKSKMNMISHLYCQKIWFHTYCRNIYQKIWVCIQVYK